MAHIPEGFTAFAIVDNPTNIEVVENLVRFIQGENRGDTPGNNAAVNGLTTAFIHQQFSGHDALSDNGLVASDITTEAEFIADGEINIINDTGVEFADELNLIDHNRRSSFLLDQTDLGTQSSTHVTNASATLGSVTDIGEIEQLIATGEALRTDAGSGASSPSAGKHRFPHFQL